MLKLRVATAVVLLLILWFAIWAGPLAFAGVMAICFGQSERAHLPDDGGDLCAVGLFVASLALRSRQLGIGFVSLPYRVGCRHLRLFLWPRLGQA